MKLSDLIQNKKTYSGTTYPIDNGTSVLQQAINKSSPSFKDTTTNQAGVPVSTKAQDLYNANANSPLAPIFRQMAQSTPSPVAPVASAQAPVAPTPEPIKDAQGNPIATPADWYAEYGYRAQNGDTNAQQWLKDNVLPDQQQNTGGIDFSTPTSQVAYSAEKLNELFGTKSPEDLFAMREQLRRDAALARAGLLPETEYMYYDGSGVTDGKPKYNYDQIMDINKSTADIFSNAAAKADKFMDDYSKGQKATGGSSGYGTNPVISTILASGKFTKEQSAAIKYAIDNGQNPTAVILNNAKNIMGNTLGTKTGQLESAYTQMQGIDALLKDFYGKGGDSSFFKGNYEKVLNKLGNVSDPKLVDLASQISSILMSYRNATTGTAASVPEDAQIKSIFPGIDKGEMLNNALTKARLSSVKREIDGNYRSALGSDYDTLLKQQESNKPSDSSGDRYIFNKGYKYKVNSDGSASLVSFNQVGSGTNQAPKVVAGYDISSYATDPNHERSVAAIYQRTPEFKSPTDIDMVIRRVAPKSRITGSMIASAANSYGVDPKMVYAMMLQDSSLGTAGMGARNNNPGNIGQYDNLNRPVAGYRTLQDGVNAVAKWLSKKKVSPGRNYA